MCLLWQRELGEQVYFKCTHFIQQKCIGKTSLVHNENLIAKKIYEVFDKKVNEVLVFHVKREGLESESHIMVL